MLLTQVIQPGEKPGKLVWNRVNWINFNTATDRREMVRGSRGCFSRKKYSRNQQRSSKISVGRIRMMVSAMSGDQTGIIQRSISKFRPRRGWFSVSL